MLDPAQQVRESSIPAHAVPVEPGKVGVVPANFDSTSRPSLPSLDLRFEASEAQTYTSAGSKGDRSQATTSCPQWEGSHALSKTFR